MGAHVFLLPHVPFIITLFFLLVFVPTSYCEEDEHYRECFTPFQCGRLSNLHYPFWRDEPPEICRHEGFQLQCPEDQFPTEDQYPVITINGQEFYVKFVNQSTLVMTIARRDLWDDVCPHGNVADIKNTTLNGTRFSYAAELETITLFYDCQNQRTYNIHKFQCPINGDVFYATDAPLSQNLPDCHISIEVPARRETVDQLIGGGKEALERALKDGFEVKYMLDPKGDGMNVGTKVGIAVGSAFAGGAIMCLIFFIYIRRRKRKPHAPSSFVSRSITSDFSSKSDIERGELLTS